MIHRALLGSLERFLGILPRAHGRATSRSGSRRCRRACSRSRTSTARARPRCSASSPPRGVRADARRRATETIGKRIRDAELEKIPYIVVFGEQEAGRGDAVGAGPRGP